MHPLLNTWVVASVAMGLLFMVPRRGGKAGWVDVLWSFGTGLCGAALALQANGPAERRWLVAALVLFWGVRLGTHLATRLRGEGEDGRYAHVMQAWGEKRWRYLFAFYQAQAVWIVLFAAPAWLAALSERALGLHDGLGLALFATSLVGEGVADRQLAGFRRDATNKGKVCQVGLWRYSRHPNYFFEWLHWFAYPCFAWGSPLGLLALYAPALMYLFLVKITGIPQVEKQALRSRGEAYARYQRTTSPLIPWFPRKVT